MIGLLLNPLVLCVLLWLVARGSADIEYGRVFFISLGVSIVGVAIAALAGGGFVALVALLPVLGLLAFLLMRYCCVSLQQALIVTGLYFAYQIAFPILVGWLLG